MTGVKLALWAQITPFIGMMLVRQMCFPNVSKMPTLAYNRVSSVYIKKAIILNIIHNTLINRNTEAVSLLLAGFLVHVVNTHVEQSNIESFDSIVPDEGYSNNAYLINRKKNPNLL